MKPIVSIIVVLMASVGVGLGQSDAVGRGQVRWVSFSEAVELSKKEPRKILIDIYTDWCGWCKKMDATTYGDGAVVEYINRHFYAVK